MGLPSALSAHSRASGNCAALRFRETVEAFVANVSPPFFLVATDAHGSIVVTEHDGNAAAKQLCSRMRAPGLMSPMTVVAIAADGAVKWAKITIEAADATLQ
jgi:hypothetical protein